VNSKRSTTPRDFETLNYIRPDEGLEHELRRIAGKKEDEIDGADIMDLVVAAYRRIAEKKKDEIDGRDIMVLVAAAFTGTVRHMLVKEKAKGPEIRFEAYCSCALCSSERGRLATDWEKMNEEERWELSRTEAQIDPGDIAWWGDVIKDVISDNSNDPPKILCAKLVEELRNDLLPYKVRASRSPGDLRLVLADLLDPLGNTTWRLELRRRRRGRKERLSESDRESLTGYYLANVDRLKADKRASAKKTVRAQIAKDWGMTDEEVRAIVERVQGKRKRKHASKPAGRK
jgi:hypothetical protein